MKALSSLLVLAALFTAWHYLPASHHQAGMGTYFLRQYVSFNSGNGMVGWTPGQEIHEVFKAPYVDGSKTVTDGKITAVVPEAILTCDVEDAEAMRLADSATQSAVQDNIATLKTNLASRDFQAQVTSAVDINRANAVQVAASRVGLYATRLNEPTRYVGSSYGGSYYYNGNPGPSSYSSSSATIINTGRVSPSQPYGNTNVGSFSRTGPTPQPTPLPAGIGTAR